jgi:hypothetical protein
MSYPVLGIYMPGEPLLQENWILNLPSLKLLGIYCVTDNCWFLKKDLALWSYVVIFETEMEVNKWTTIKICCIF